MERKLLPLTDCQVKMDGETGRFSGYASVFGGIDAYGDTIVKGAYADTIRNFPAPKMFFNHESYKLPIGKWYDLGEDDIGLRVDAELTLDMSFARDVHAALKHGTVDGISVGIVLSKDDYELRPDGGRLIKKVKRLVEASVVTFPADGAARVELGSVKSEEIEGIETIRDFERFLRDAGGLSKGLTEALVSRAKIVFAAGDPQAPKIDAKAAQELAAAIERISGRFPASLNG
jgi:HK97 family phage prohead protease